jgi:hypothetical protein
MRREEISRQTSLIAFDFFFWFSRFEYALKDNGYLRTDTPGAAAEPGWEKFTVEWETRYTLSGSAGHLLAAPPQLQIVGEGGNLSWRPVRLTDCKTDLAKVVRLVKTIRNNLFHGGKHGSDDWDNAMRTEALLVSGKRILDERAVLARLEADFRRIY